MTDEFAHARIDALQQQTSEWIADILMALPNRRSDYNDHVKAVLQSFKNNDQFAAKGIPSDGRVDPSTVRSGLYRIYWTTGGSSDAAVGVAANGDRWIAATNWCECLSTDWSHVARIEPLR